MKKNTKRIILSVFIISIILCLFPITTFAASASASASKSTVKPGDTVTVTFKFSNNDIGGVTGSFSYDSKILQFNSANATSGSGDITNGGIVLWHTSANNSSLSGKITFKALKEGSTKVSFSSNDIVSFSDEKALGSANTSTTITVKKPTASKPKPDSTTPKPDKPKNEQEEPEEAPPNPVEEALKISLEGKTLYMWKDLSSVKLPEGFKPVDLSYKTEKIQGAESNGINIVYLTDQDGKNGSFYILDPSEELFPLINLNTAAAFTLLPPSSSTKLPDGYKETELELDGKTIQAWQHDSEENPDFYLLYLMNKEGKKDFYLYDQAEKTMQRYSDRTVIVEVEKEPEPLSFFQKLTNDKSLLAVVGALGTLSIILLITLIILYKKSGKTGKH